MAAPVGLTGGIGSGKSTVARLFCDNGILVIDADQIARDVTRPDSNALEQIRQRFGESVITDAGELDRKALGDIVFADSGQRAWLEHLLHPLIRQSMDDRARACGDPWCILEIPLLIESGRYKDMKKVIVVQCPDAIRIQRLQASRGMTAEQIQQVMDSQATEDQRRAGADYLVDNSGTELSLVPQVREIIQSLNRYFTAREDPATP